MNTQAKELNFGDIVDTPNGAGYVIDVIDATVVVKHLVKRASAENGLIRFDTVVTVRFRPDCYIDKSPLQEYYGINEITKTASRWAHARW